MHAPAADRPRSAYLDHAASTPMLRASRDAMIAAWELPGNPSSVHSAGRNARRLVEESREQIAAALGAQPLDVVFTSGGTEGANLAVTGLYRGARAADPARRRVVVSAVEHPSVLRTAESLADGPDGAEVVVLPVDGAGVVRLSELSDALGRDGGPATVAVVSVMLANNEVGAVQPVAAIAAMCAQVGVPLHTDAVQAIGELPIDLGSDDLAGVSALSLSGHKFGGPPGTGALLLRREWSCRPILHGGGQERGLRSGSIDVPGAVGLAAAVADVTSDVAARAGALERLRELLVAAVVEAIPDAVLNGPSPGPDRLPGNAHFSFPGASAEALLMVLDAAGVCCSAGAACEAGVARPSHVLSAMGVPRELTRASVRFSLGATTTDEEIGHLMQVLPNAVAVARS